MGVLNATPDSFSDGGEWNETKKAKNRILEMAAAGADIIDIGGESTGPGAQPVNLEEELARVIPVLKAVREVSEIPISIDTYKSEVAEEGLKNGANMINDVTALRGDKKMTEILAKSGYPVILMYSKDQTPHATVQDKEYQDVIKEVSDFLKERIEYATAHGIKPEQIIIDPGMGQFVSNIAKYSFEIIARLKELTNIGRPILLGASRKSFLGGPLSTRDTKGQMISAIAYLNGASIIRTHDVKGTVEIINHLKNTNG